MNQKQYDNIAELQKENDELRNILENLRHVLKILSEEDISIIKPVVTEDDLK